MSKKNRLERVDPLSFKVLDQVQKAKESFQL